MKGPDALKIACDARPLGDRTEFTCARCNCRVEAPGVGKRARKLGLARLRAQCPLRVRRAVYYLRGRA